MAMFNEIEAPLPNAPRDHLQAYLDAEGGATAIEYALIAAGIAVVIVGAVTAIGGKLTSTFTKVSSGF